MGWNIVSGPEVGYWVTQHTDGVYHPDVSSAIGLVRNDEMMAGVIYENWNHQSVVVHIAWKRLTPAYLGAIFDYAYNVCDVHKIIGPINSSNTKALNLVKKLGFTEEARIKDAAPNGDIVIMTQTRDACRYLGARYGQKFTKATCNA